MAGSATRTVYRASLKSSIAPLESGGAQSVLKYFNYSVVMNKDRRLAFFSCVNIDGGQQQDVGKREGDSWLRDPRLKDEFQIGNEFYGKQSTFEAERSANPFDRGHLVRRLDATWGSTVKQAKEHGDDSFHFTNCTLQLAGFNEGKDRWQGLELYLLEKHARKEKKVAELTGNAWEAQLMLVADQTTPYRLLTEVLYSCGQAGYGNYRLLVLKSRD